MGDRPSITCTCTCSGDGILRGRRGKKQGSGTLRLRSGQATGQRERDSCSMPSLARTFSKQIRVREIRTKEKSAPIGALCPFVPGSLNSLSLYLWSRSLERGLGFVL